MVRQEMRRFQHSLGLALGHQLFWLAGLLTLILAACSAEEAPVQPVRSNPAQSNSQAVIPASDPPDTAGIVSANAGEEPTVPPQSQSADEITQRVIQDRAEPVLPQMQLLNVADTVERARPAVVSIVAEARIRGIYGDLYSVFGNGTGVIFDPKGLVLTNTHVIDRATTITVTMDDGRQEEATIIGADPMSDLAVLQLSGSDYPHLPLSSGTAPRVGDWVIAIGNALALPGGPTVTVGVVSALGRSLDVSPEITLYDLI